MSFYPDHNPGDPADEITIIEDANMVINEKGKERPGFQFIDSHTVMAHPVIIDVLLLLEDAERVWTLEEVLGDLEDFREEEEL